MIRDGVVNPGSIGPVATRVVDGSTWHVALDLAPAAPSLIPGICRALVQARVVALVRYLGDLKPIHPEYAETLGKITDALADALTVQLQPAAAERLSGELYESVDEPDLCRWGEGDCANYTDAPDGYCSLHEAVAEDVSDRIRGIR